MERSTKASEAILKSKIHPPPLSTDLLMRPQLINKLNSAFQCAAENTRKLSLVSAPAGFGKTTLIRQWMEESPQKCCWYSLDDSDNEFQRFWRYFISSVQQFYPKIGETTLEMISSRSIFEVEDKNFEVLLTPFINELFELEEGICFVLDDYHQISDSMIHESMAFFIENISTCFHLITTTRSDPPWPMHKWRVKNQMTEIRQSDLKMSREEAVSLFDQLMPEKLSEKDKEGLYHKTEGWVTALRLAAISLMDRQDPEVFIRSFAGSHRHVLFFLTEEVFAKQTQDLRQFLMTTSILNRFNSQLCNALTGREDGSLFIETLLEHNLFLIPLDDLGEWYRYHPLFKDLLLHYLKKEYPKRINSLYDKAMDWHLEEGSMGEAIRLGFKSESFERTTEILDDNMQELMNTETVGQVVRWIMEIPLKYLKRAPQVMIYRAMAHYVQSGIVEARRSLEEAKKLTYGDPERQKEFEGMTSIVQAYDHILNNEFENAQRETEKALQVLTPEINFWRLAAYIFRGDAKLFSGDAENAAKEYQQAYRDALEMSNHHFAISTGLKVAYNHWFKGEHVEAARFADELIELSEKAGLSKLPKIGFAWALLGDAEREKGNLEKAECLVQKGLKMSEPEVLTHSWNSLFDLSLKHSQKEWVQGKKIIEKLEGIHRREGLAAFIMMFMKIWKAKFLMAMEQLEDAQAVLREIGVLEDQQVSNGLEFGYVTLAEILLKQEKFLKAEEILSQIQLQPAYEQQQKIRIETLLLRSRLEEQLENKSEAETIKKEAIQFAQQKGFNQTLLDYEAREKSPGISKAAGKDQPLIEALSSRELEILGLIKDGLSNSDISRKLHLSPGTVKWHTSNIYGKLAVKNRTQAVAYARELKLIED